MEGLLRDALVMSSTVGGLVAGIVLGGVGALITARFVTEFLYDVRASDPWTYITVCSSQQ